MSEHLKLVAFSAGDTLFLENEQSYFFYMIQEGTVEVYKTGDDGRKVTLAQVEGGQPLGEFAMIDQRPRSASARALTDGTAVRISEEGYAEMLNELPAWARAMMERLVDRLRAANQIIEDGQKADEKTTTQLAASEFNTVSSVKLDSLDFSALSKSRS